MSKSKKMKSNSNIECDVVSCENNNCEEGTCCLEKVCISCNCANDDCHETYETVCQSFKENGSNITDNEYEVTSETLEN